MKKYNWGIIGTGIISNLFAEGLSSLGQANIHAVGSRSQKTAQDFAHKWDVKRAYETYEDLYSDAQIDIVYIGTPHNFHYRNVGDALRAGKHVLCEKPFTINALQGRELVALARQEKLFLMDAMWNRFQPWYAVVKDALEEDRIGELFHLKADLSFRFDVGPEHRIFNPDLAGGALLDLGVYPVALASAFLGKPQETEAFAHLHDSGVDDQVSMIFKYASGALAELGCSSRYFSKNNATLHGSKGYLELHGMINRPERITIHENGKPVINIDTPLSSNGYQYQAQAVMDMLEQGLIEHIRMPLDETITILETMDQIRSTIGVKYPDE